MAFVPELPDVQVYIEHLERRVAGRTLERVRLLNPFILRTAVPPIRSAEGRKVIGIRRIGKRIVFALDGGLFLVGHLMIAGRFRWLEGASKPPGRISLALLEFDNGTLVLTEAGTKRRASMHLVEGEDALLAMDPGGAAPGAGRSRLPRQGNRVPRAHGGARPLRQALPRVRLAGAAHRVRGERIELLRALPDGRKAARRPGAFVAAQEELAAID
jgi:hypothetical protein